MRSGWVLWMVLASLFFLITLARSWMSIQHLPPDPGLEFQILAKTDGLTKIFNSYNGYPQVLPRLISEFLNLVPLSQLTYWSTLINALISMVCALAITRAISELIGIKTAILVGLVLSTAFPAHEGLVGNLWAIRWILIPATCIFASIPAFSQKHWRFTLLVFLTTGLSHAYIFIPTGTYLVQAYLRCDFRKRTVLLGSTLVILTAYQGFGYLSSSRQLQLYGDSTVYWPWAGSGVFWWSVFTIPMVFALVAFLPNLKLRRQLRQSFTPQSSIAIQAILLSIISYVQLGVKSSPAVATVTVSYAAIMVAFNTSNELESKFKVDWFVKLFCSLLLLVLSVRFYFPSYFLTNGTGWPKTVAAASVQCQSSDLDSVKLTVFEIRELVQSETFPCNTLENWDLWFFQRQKD
jgi:hypothetical protein